MADTVNATTQAPKMSPVPHVDESRTMKSAEWWGKKTVEVKDRPVPLVTEPADAILKVTSTCICGSDLHLYVGAMPGMQKGDRLGHEFMGIVEDIGPNVQQIKKGDRVVSAFDIGCGSCLYCNKKLYSSCAASNPAPAQDALYGTRVGGFHGYSHLTGGWPGGQAEYARVPHADLNLLKVPDNMTDDQVVLLSDILPTAWHACEMGEVHDGDVVAIWGAGPVGILAVQCAFARGAKRVILIDGIEYRLNYAKKVVPGVETLDYTKVKSTVVNSVLGKSVVAALHELTGQDGVDVVIECVGFHYAKSLVHKIEMMLMLETDPSEMINEMISSVRKGGRVSIAGAYAGYCNHFNIGAFMEKQLTMRGGQTPVQKYWHDLLAMVQKGTLDPTVVITHRLPLEQAPEGYKIFNEKVDECIKVVLKPGMKA